MSKKINIVITDDHPLYLEGVSLLLAKFGFVNVIKTVASGEELIEFATKNKFDVLLLDLHLPGIDGIETAARLNAMKHSCKIIMLTMQRGGRYLNKLEKMNIKGYVLKNISPDELAKAIVTVSNGETYINKDLSEYRHDADVELKSSVYVTDMPDKILSEREREILVLVCSELSSSQIAERLHISVGTVDTHRKNILIKLGVNNTVGLVKYALKHRLID
jgi:DNA-binding NarL/FixJ family response regulator